ncbi:NAD(P)-dependent alcohol dehydrogenase [Devosia ginsengisoli]|uniref:NAD(P)-dependent alcohol dehydrogenase n=1 Tax=Devosia ginsengisoli TaxID=400770 RepID=A0A5B8LRW4_9HYPH|nr:NAD(P)-dependent alcohol dehydrogenase [Devosia ginsengisoli]QDZ10903.1 NAD(P)-dependent alcohol dehydrogenase [Devosia ginsengisoli]
MRIVTQSRYGGPDVLEIRDVPRPVPKENEILVRVEAFSVTLADCAFRKADPFITRFFNGLLRPKNLVLGDDIGGVVEAVGSAVTRFAVGDAIFGSVGSSLGGAADYVCLAEDAAVVRRPDGLDAGQGAGLSYGYLTAMPFMRDEGQVKPGDHVLINGAAGSVGAVALQLARHFGAEVTAVCSARHADLMRALGADHVIDRNEADFTTARDAYDVIFDAVGKSSFGRCRAALKPGGIYLTTVPSLAIIWHMLTKRAPGRRGRLATTGLRPVSAKRADLAVLAELVEAGAVRAVTDRRFPLTEVVEAHRYVETERKAGDVVVEMAW